jgi:hypothetical protein
MDDDDLGWLSLGAQQPEWDVVSSNPNYTYADEYDKGYGGAYQTGDNAIPSGGQELYPGWTGTGLTGFINSLNRAGGASSLLGKGLDFATSNQGIMALLAAFAALKDRQEPTGGGAGYAYAGPKPITRTMTQGAYGPIARFAANGGLMQAYANGGKVQMEDGGFVMTADAVKGAGGPQGLRRLLPDATMVYGRGTGTSDDIPAVINGPNGQTPARLSNGEAYVPPGRDTKGLYALMHELERKA